MEDSKEAGIIGVVSAMVMAFVVVTISFMTVIASMQEREKVLVERVSNLEMRAKYYDDVMVTYQFFNERWTATMKGER